MRLRPGEVPQYGGQAVIEGVMMRGPSVAAVAVRRRDAAIHLERRRLTPPGGRPAGLRLPVVRGVVALWEALSLGVWALWQSANQSLEEDERLSTGEMVLTLVLAVALAVGLFALAPTAAAGGLKRLIGAGFWLHLAEGLIRVAILIAYLAAITRLPDIRRVLAYHGAEHKVINAYEAGWALEPDAVGRASRFHPRCGTSFLLYVVLLSALLFSFFGWPGLLFRVAIRLAALPVIAGLAYEILKWSSRSRSPVSVWLAWPGLWLQRLTTREPDEAQLEVAIRALEGVLEEAGDAPAVR